MSIARQAGLVVDGRCLTGPELDGLDDAALAARLADTDVFCRVQPEQKLRLVQAFRARGEVVAMTGDGVNDAPALKAAHIGVAMGARGTDVAREAAALVLLNDDFASLVTAVRYGRRVFANLRKAITFVLAVHLPIVGPVDACRVLLGWPMVLMPVHILFLQLIIDPACSIVFEAEPLGAEAMRVPPRRSGCQRLFDRAGAVARPGARVRAVGDRARGLPARALGVRLRRVGACAGVLGAGGQQPGADPGQPDLDAAPRSTRPWNAAFGWIASTTCGLLALVLWVPAVSGLFVFATPSTTLLLIGAALCLGALAWFEATKRLVSRRAR